MTAGSFRPAGSRLSRLRVRVVRSVGLDRNPMRRVGDRAQAWLTPALVAAFLLLGPAVAMRAARGAYAEVLRDGAAARQQRFPAGAVVEIWTDARGDVAAPPPREADARGREVASGLVALFVVGARSPVSGRWRANWCCAGSWRRGNGNGRPWSRTGTGIRRSLVGAEMGDTP